MNLREAYATWQPIRGFYVEAGRINVREGVALGFNPTDFFKTRTLVGQSSLDPSVIRQNRLGAVMFRAHAAFISGNFGAPRSDRGSFPQTGTLTLQITRYF